ncbi:MAG: restriction endonuclease subunit R [Cyanobacteria bacterium RI_101]|nr:restriction endonuclease subunit R [Cyanobacteria bacterium RI_101]
MKPVVIENPILNSPFEEPQRHFRFNEDGITDEIAEGRRRSHYFIPIAQPKKRGKQMEIPLGDAWTRERVEENRFINEIREKVGIWRRGGYQSAVKITPTTRTLLDYWQRPDRERKMFFCQIEALETAIYITEVAKPSGDTYIDNQLRRFGEEAGSTLPRMAFKMATGSGKTVVMAMLIAWQALNKIARPQSRLFSDAFLLVAPGITIRDRLRVLQPNDAGNYYRALDLVPDDQTLMAALQQAKIVIVNYHNFQLKETNTEASKLTKSLLIKGKDANPFVETPDQMTRRVCRDLGNKKNIIVLNDEAHHCYHRKPNGDEEETYKGDDRKEAKENEENARVWSSGLEAIQRKLGIRAVYDLSATPFYLKGSGYKEGTLFPWVVSDFSLIEAIESGIVKIPRVPVIDNSMKGELPTYRNIWALIRDDLPKKSRTSQEQNLEPAPKLPKELEGALKTLYENYEKYYAVWDNNQDARARGLTPPVFIVVCNNTSVSKLVYDWIAGWDTGKVLPNDQPVLAPGQLSLFSNVENGGWSARPRTILVDSAQLDSGEGMTPEFKQIAAREIEEFKDDFRLRFPGQDANKITDEELLREVMNTVGKAGKLGEQVRCVVSVSMLTEGWDCGTVTHILGVRAFGTQLLCEQVVGRALRRISYGPNEQNRFEPEYAEVYGVPFAFIPCAGSSKTPKPGPAPTRVRSLPERSYARITFPRLLGYRYEMTRRELRANFDHSGCRYILSTENLPTMTVNAPIVGESSIHTLDDLKQRRLQEVAFLLAKLTLERYFRQDGEAKTAKEAEHRFDAEVQVWLFPQVLRIAKDWLRRCLVEKAGTFPQMLLLTEFAYDASDCIYQAIAAGESDKYLKPILHPQDYLGSTDGVDFDTSRPVFVTDPLKCHVSHATADSNYENKMAQVFEEMDEVIYYVKNQGLGLMIPYAMAGQSRNYLPDFVCRVNDGRGPDNLLNLIVEASGQSRRDKALKVQTARNFWLPAVNGRGDFGRWQFINITDPWNAQNTIRAALASDNFQQFEGGLLN